MGDVREIDYHYRYDAQGRNVYVRQEEGRDLDVVEIRYDEAGQVAWRESRYFDVRDWGRVYRGNREAECAWGADGLASWRYVSCSVGALRDLGLDECQLDQHRRSYDAEGRVTTSTHSTKEAGADGRRGFEVEFSPGHRYYDLEKVTSWDYDAPLVTVRQSGFNESDIFNYQSNWTHYRRLDGSFVARDRNEERVVYDGACPNARGADLSVAPAEEP